MHVKVVGQLLLAKLQQSMKVKGNISLTHAGSCFRMHKKVCVLKTVIGEVHMILTFVHPKYILPFKTIITYLFGEVFYPLITVIRESKKYFTRIKRKNIETQNTIVVAVWLSSSSSRCIVWCLCGMWWEYIFNSRQKSFIHYISSLE